jgi:PAS domain S-box-containing protein
MTKKKENTSSGDKIVELQNRISYLEAIAANSKKTEETLKKTRRDLDTRNKVVEAINAVADNIYRALDYSSLAKAAIAAMVEYGKTATATMFEYNEDENCLVMIDSSIAFVKAYSRVLTQRLYPGQSAAGDAVKEKKIILCKDIATDPRILPATKEALLKEGRKSGLFIPLLFQDRALGTINLVYNKKFSFKDYELETLLSIGKTIGLAMANVRHIETIKAEAEERKIAQKAMAQSIASLKTVNTVADRIYRALDYGTLVNEALTAMSHHGKSTAAYMYEYEEETDALLLLNAIGAPIDPRSLMVNERLPVNQSLSGQAIRQKKIIICEDIAANDRIEPAIKAAMLKANRAASVSIPLLFQGRALGVINLLFAEKIKFTDYELETLFSIGKTIGLAMANARHIETIKAEVEERKSAEEALRLSEEKYRLLIENAHDAIFITQEGFITYANPRTLKLLGFDMEELLRKPVASFLIAENNQANRNKKTGSKNVADATSCKLINKKLVELSLEVNIIDVVWENKKASLYFGRDVTNQKKLEAQLHRAQKMEAIGTLAGGLAHDFNNLLMGIQGNTSLMLLQTPSGQPHYERLKNIEQYVASGAEITGQLLGFARGGKYEVKPINLNNLIEKNAQMFGRTKKEISIHENYYKNLWTVEVDRGQIEQVLLNLYVNAWQAMPRGGHLYLSTINISVDENMANIHQIQKGRYVRASITDDGIGMDEETQMKLFDPFFTTKVRSRGTGLGLASAYGIIKNHGGTISVYSAKGKGATFNIYLPASEKEAISDEAIAEDSLSVGKETILFVDDEDMIVNVGRDMLETMGYKVITANSGKEALQIYEKSKIDIDLVILDLIMPHLSGEATFKKIKEINPEAKVLLSSGYSINGQATKLIEQGCRGFIQKPYSINELSTRIREIFDQK